MNTEQAIKKLKELEDERRLNIESWAVKLYIAAIKFAVAVLREKAEREKGCEHCDDDCCPRLNWHYGLDHILPGYKYCPMCGRKLQESHK